MEKQKSNAASGQAKAQVSNAEDSCRLPQKGPSRVKRNPEDPVNPVK